MDKKESITKENCKNEVIRRQSKILDFTNKIFKAQISSS